VSDIFRCVMVGVVHPIKNQVEAIRAIALLRTAGRKADLTIIGAGVKDHIDLLNRLAGTLGVSDSVRFIGEISHDDLMGCLHHYDALLMCSRNEAFGRVTIEAMSKGLPVIGADCGGTSEIISHGETGFLYPPGDIDQLRGYIAFLMDSPNVVRIFGESAKERVQTRFSKERYRTELLALVSEGGKL